MKMADDHKAAYIRCKTEELFWQIYVQDVSNDGLGDGADKEAIEQIYKNISETVSVFYDLQNLST
jgi:hypothetical protein